MDDFPLRGFSFPSSSIYTIVEELGRGGMGVVYLVEKNCEGVLDYAVFKGFRTLDEEQEARLRNEANIATFLRHENIVKTYGLEACKLADMPQEFRKALGAEEMRHPVPATGEVTLPKFHLRRLVAPLKDKHTRRTPGFTPARMPNPRTNKIEAPDSRKLLFMVMDYVDGADLAMFMRHHMKLHMLMPAQLAMFVVGRMARALAYAHQWIVHKDVTPGNILISNEGVPKLADFGIASPTWAAGEEFAGKVHYMAPEQLARGRVDGRADIFSLGCVAYELLTGVNLFKPLSRGAWSENVKWVKSAQARPVVPPHKFMHDIPESLSNIVMKMLSMDPERRYQRMMEIDMDLEKQYLHAQGFGPTNGSMAAYLRIFEAGFSNADQDDLRQLTFLRNEQRRISLQRRITAQAYTKEGIEQIQMRKKTPIYNILARQESGTRPTSKVKKGAAAEEEAAEAAD